MPTYDYRCKCGEITEARRGVEVSSLPCPLCGGTAHRVPVYEEQYTRTDSGGMQGRMGKAGTIPESVERYARNSATIEKETGNKSGLKLR
jgi:putative FmdB family regulatory protein